MYHLLQPTLDAILQKSIISNEQINHAKFLLHKHIPTVLHYGKEEVLLVFGKDNPDVADVFITIRLDSNEKNLVLFLNKKETPWNSFGLASLQYLKSFLKDKKLSIGQKYTREGMRRRVWYERQLKAKNANYTIKLGESLYGEHTLINEIGKAYKITLWDLDKCTGYINNIDWKTNKLGTTKHILYLCNYLKENPALVEPLSKDFPFIEVFTDPFHDYRIAWHFPETLTIEESEFLNKFFGDKNFILEDQHSSFLPFLEEARNYERIKVRDEVYEKLEAHYEARELSILQRQVPLDFSVIRGELYPYQKEGVEFSVYKSGVIIADEMGLGKTIQAITTAVLKKGIFGFKKTLVICPASVKHQWQNEIHKFTSESSCIVSGSPEERERWYNEDNSFFHIINYETVLRDLTLINTTEYDFVILDEAQKIKNYESKTAIAIKQINKKHGMVITGTPLENKLLDIYSIIQFLDQGFLSPQWEFSYQYCIFDRLDKNKIIGYYNLNQLKERLSSILIRREKNQVFDQLPEVIERDVFVTMTPTQLKYHDGFKKDIAKVLSKRSKTTYDWQRLMMLLNSMRRVADSSFLIDKKTNDSPKITELMEILVEHLNIKKESRKVIIFSEWVTMLQLIADRLKNENIGYKLLSGKVPISKRKELLNEFEQSNDYNVLLSSETGGAGLNLQSADTIINFELPWNPAKKSQRLGRINRIGQEENKLHVYNLIAHNSIELGISKGLILKQNLFDRILNKENTIEEFDSSDDGRSEFLNKLQHVLNTGEISQSKKLSTNNNSSSGSNIKNTEVKAHLSVLQIEKVIAKGLHYINDLYEMSEGVPLTHDKPTVHYDDTTGKITITFNSNQDIR